MVWFFINKKASLGNKSKGTVVNSSRKFKLSCGSLNFVISDDAVIGEKQAKSRNYFEIFKFDFSVKSIEWFQLLYYYYSIISRKLLLVVFIIRSGHS